MLAVAPAGASVPLAAMEALGGGGGVGVETVGGDGATAGTTGGVMAAGFSGIAACIGGGGGVDGTVAPGVGGCWVWAACCSGGAGGALGLDCATTAFSGFWAIGALFVGPEVSHQPITPAFRRRTTAKP